MKTWNLALEAWYIQDGLYPDFAVGDEHRFAVEMRPRTLEAADPDAGVSIRPLGNSFYSIQAPLRRDAPNGCLLLDTTPPIYCLDSIPAALQGARAVRGEVVLALDSGGWSDDLRYRGGAPVIHALWRIEQIFRDTRFWRTTRMLERRLIMPGARLQHPLHTATREGQAPPLERVPRTEGWHDDGGVAHYVLSCELVD